MRKFTITILLIMGIITFLAFRDKDHDPNNQHNTVINPHPVPFAVDSKQLDANTISTWFRTNGSFNRDPVTGNAGFIWPKGTTKTASYAGGVWLGAVQNNDSVVCVAEYDYEYINGYTDANHNPEGKDDPAFKVYKLYQGQENSDRTSWPNALIPGNSDQGAPVYFDAASNSYKALDFGSQTLYCRFTDSYPETHGVEAGSTRPLKADIMEVDFSYAFGGALGQIVFSQFTIINQSNQDWHNCYLCVWKDDDLGTATDDLVGVDTSLNLGFTYNGTNQDGVYGTAPPAIGTNFFRGAMVYTGNQTDTAKICVGKSRNIRLGYHLLGLDVFNWYYNGQDPRNHLETYRTISGYHPRPGVAGDTGLFIINPSSHQPTHKMYDGDPVTGTGWVQTGPNDQRLLESSGPFEMPWHGNVNAHGLDTQVVVIGQIIGKGSSNLNSITQMRSNNTFAKLIYDSCFNVPQTPPAPKVTYYAPGNGKIYLSWDTTAEHLVISNFFSGGLYKFQGYNVYMIRPGTNGQNASDRFLIATYDKKDTITNIYDSTYIDAYQGYVYGIVQQGFDNGVKRFIEVSRDAVTGLSLINGTPYYFAVTAYDYDSTAGPHSGTTRVNETPVNNAITMVTPQSLTQGSQINYNFGDTIGTSHRDLGVMPIVVNPLQLVNAAYTSTFSPVGGLSFTLTRTVGSKTDTIQPANYREFNGTQDSAINVDGLMIVHQIVVDSGVVKDPDDPFHIMHNIQTRLQGWTYNPPENLWLTGPDTAAITAAKVGCGFTGHQFDSRSIGMSFPNSDNYRTAASRIKANGIQFTLSGGSNPNLTGGPLRKIRIVFDNQSPPDQRLAYRYVPTISIHYDTNFANTPYRDMVPVPFKVYAVDLSDSSGGTPRQLNVAFIDVDSNGVWDPDSSKLGKFQLTYIMASSYSSTPYAGYTSRNPAFNSNFGLMDIMYVWLPRAKRVGNAQLSFTNGDQLEVHPYIPTRAEFVPGIPERYQWSIQGSVVGNNSIASSRNQMDKVKVFPNPYYGYSRLEINPVDRFVYFSNLPATCTIYIYSLSGVLVRKILRSNSDPNNSLERWDLRNQDDIPAASGMYIALVDAPGIGTKVLKFAIFTPQERIDTY